MRRLLLGITLAGALLATSACEVGVGVDVDVAENGSGTVAVGISLDRAAADALGDLASQLDLQDLALAGWDVTGPAREADNLLWVRATKHFGSAEELPTVLAEIAGPDVFDGFQLRRRTEFAEQTWEVAGQVDPAAALPELFDTLAFNQGLGERVRGAVGDFGGNVPLEGLTVRLSIDLPGDLTAGDGDFTWTALSEDSSPVTVRMAAREENTTAKTLRLVGLAAAALFVLALLLNVLGWWYIRRVRKRRASALMAKADSEQIPTVVAAVAGERAAPSAGEPPGTGIPWGAAGADPTAAAGDDVDWGELADAGFEDLAGDIEDPTPAGASPGDWTASGGWTASRDWTASGEEIPGVGPETGAAAAGPEGSEAMTPPPDEPAEADEVAAPEEPATDEVAPIVGWVPAEQPLAFDEPAAAAEPAPDGTAERGEPAATAEPDEAGPDKPAEPDEILPAEPASDEPPRPEEAESESDEPAEPDDEAESDEPAEPDDEAESDEPAEPDDEAEDDEPTESDEAESEADSDGADAAPAPPSRALRLVVIGGWGVLFQPADPASELLVPFVQQAGATASPAEIRESYRLATLGRLTPDQLWESCGLTGTPTWTHGPYTGRMSVPPGAAEFVRALLRRDIGVACVTNDVADWSWRLRAWTGFEAVSPWVVSSDIGIRKPDPGVFEMLRRVAEIPFANCLVIDHDAHTLDAARSLGMSTGLFGVPATDPSGTPSSHPTVGNFTDLLRRT